MVRHVSSPSTKPAMLCRYAAYKADDVSEGDCNVGKCFQTLLIFIDSLIGYVPGSHCKPYSHMYDYRSCHWRLLQKTYVEKEVSLKIVDLYIKLNSKSPHQHKKETFSFFCARKRDHQRLEVRREPTAVRWRVGVPRNLLQNYACSNEFDWALQAKSCFASVW